MKKVFVLIAVVAISAAAHAQFSFSYGLGVFLAGGKAEKADGQSLLLNYGVTGNPRYNITENESSSISISAPITLGMTGSVNSRSGASSDASFLLNAPLMVDYNSGCGSTSDKTEGIGFFGGVGYGFHTGASVESGSAKATGPIANAGLRFPLSLWGDGQVVSVRLSYMKGLNDNKTNVFGLNLLIK
ncbi:hypothetical protein ACQ33O_03685 [Ferruginibacter sp. SUN002]|uniref:hypothetical protein n=1 Tax=Ferruginibacter sp. SUN002 TaxID=2937789 RepID=UPI003D36BAD1